MCASRLRAMGIVGLGMLIGLCMPVRGQSPRLAPVTATPADEQQIRQAIIAFVENYNGRKLDALVAQFTADAVFILKDGSEFRGAAEIRKTFEDAFSDNVKAAISLTVDSIRFVTSDVAIEVGASTNFPDGATETSRSRYTVLHVKRDGKWLMNSARVEEEEVLSAYEQLRQLEWMVGDWIDEGRDEIVETTVQWADNKSFLLQEFQVIREAKVALKGSQRIGWDPQAKQIRSWVFDSAGGFGEASWTRVDDQWICKAKGVQMDGTSASATRILDQLSKDRMVWSSVDRLAGDQRLPDVEVIMVRKPPKPQ